MTILYKITNENGQTKNYTQWGQNIEHRANGQLAKIDLNAFTDPLLAVLLSPIYCNFKRPQLWEAEGDIEKENALHVECTRLKTIRQIELPQITAEQRIRFAILLIKEVYINIEWNNWADKWLRGENQNNMAAWIASKTTWLPALKVASLVATTFAMSDDSVAVAVACIVMSVVNSVETSTDDEVKKSPFSLISIAHEVVT
jgi:hypothetical protein